MGAQGSRFACGRQPIGTALSHIKLTLEPVEAAALAAVLCQLRIFMTLAVAALLALTRPLAAIFGQPLQLAGRRGCIEFQAVATVSGEGRRAAKGDEAAEQDGGDEAALASSVLHGEILRLGAVSGVEESFSALLIWKNRRIYNFNIPIFEIDGRQLPANQCLISWLTVWMPGSFGPCEPGRVLGA